MKTKLLLLLPVLLLAGCSVADPTSIKTKSDEAYELASAQFVLDYPYRYGEFSYTYEIRKETIYRTDIYWHYEANYDYHVTSYLVGFGTERTQVKEIMP